MRNRLMLCLAALIVCIPGAWGQNANTNWNNLKQIARGRRVHVVETNLRSTDGKFVSFSDSELVLEINKTQVSIPREKVFRVSEDHRRGRNALIAGLVGAGIGAGVGAAASNQFHSSDKKDRCSRHNGRVGRYLRRCFGASHEEPDGLSCRDCPGGRRESSEIAGSAEQLRPTGRSLPEPVTRQSDGNILQSARDC